MKMKQAGLCYERLFSFYNFILLSLTLVTSFPPAVQSVVPSLDGLCPYSRYCTRGPAVNISDQSRRACCGHCSCHAECWAVGSCCPDIRADFLSLPAGQSNFTPFQCKTQFDLYNNGRGISFHDDLAGSIFRIIDACYKVDRANESCFDPSDIADYVIVSDVENEFVFKNQKCAACNGFTNVTSWNLAVRCPEIITLPFDSESDVIEYVLSKCAIMSLPPTQEIGMNSFCIDNTINKCNITGRWSTYDEQIEHQCTGFRQTFINGQFSRWNIYNNIYCFLCNNKNDSSVADVCSQEIDEEILKSIVPKTSFFAIINLVPVDQLHSSGNCKRSEILDPFKDPPECKQLICPLAHVPFNGVCRSMYDTVNAFVISSQVIILMDETLTAILRATQRTNPSIVGIIRDTIWNVFGLASVGCRSCHLFIYEGKQNGNLTEFHINLSTRTSKSCSRSILTERLFSRQRQFINTSLTLVGIRGNIVINGTLTSFVKLPTFKLVVLNVFNRCELHVDISQARAFLECSRIKVTKDDLDRRGINSSLHLKQTKSDLINVNDIMQGPNNATFLVCKQFYFSSVNSTGSIHAPVAVITTILYLMITLFMMD